MAAPFDTIAIDTETWDVLVQGGSFVVLKGADAVAQDMASACRLFDGEYIFDDTVGIPFLSIFGYTVSLPILKADYVAAASGVPGTANIACFITSVQQRLVSGQVQANLAGTDQVVAASISGITPLPQPATLSPTLTGAGGTPILTGGPGGPDLTGGP